MSKRWWLVGGGVWMLSLVATGVLVNAQAFRWTPVSEPKVFSGSDIGFRVEWLHGETPAGHLMVRINGQWVEAEIGRPPNQLPIAPSPPQPPMPPPRTPEPAQPERR